MIKAIFLDFEGVIEQENDIVTAFFYPECKDYMSFEELKDRYHLARDGKITYAKMFEGVPREKHFAFMHDVNYLEDSKEALEELSKKIPLYLASDHFDTVFEKEIEKLDAKKYFKQIFVSYELGTHKPLPDFFEKILVQSGCKANECIFVDDAKANLATAKQFGFTTVWMNLERPDTRNKVEYKPDYEIKNLVELIKIIDKINSK
jgi:putative hydrolase of the HAD superfamily